MPMRNWIRSGLVCWVMALGGVPVFAEDASRIPDYTDEEVQGIHVNYTEANVGDYTLPPLLELENGESVTSARMWLNQRRPEILELLRKHQFGRAPGRPEEMTFDVYDEGSPAFDGLAKRKQVTIYFSGNTTTNAPQMDLLVYTPTKAKEPVPLLLHISFAGNSQTVDDPGVRPSRIWNRAGQRVNARGPSFFGPLDIRPFLEAGFGFATMYYGDLERDAVGGFAGSIREHYLKPGQDAPAPDEWGAIAAWAWGMSRAMDYFETDRDVDQARVAITGASRLGKTAAWAMAIDERFALLLSSVSGEGGFALSRREYGETIAHLVHPDRFPYWYCDNYDQYAPDPGRSPVDGHMLLAACAPRPVLIQTGRGDKWSDPMGEWLAAKAATPVWALFGKKGVEECDYPPTDEPIMHPLGWLMHDGGHGVLPGDWEVFRQYMENYLKE